MLQVQKAGRERAVAELGADVTPPAATVSWFLGESHPWLAKVHLFLSPEPVQSKAV